MSHKLSLGAIAATLAALGGTGLVACGGSNEPAESAVGAKEVPAASEPAEPPEPVEPVSTEVAGPEEPTVQGGTENAASLASDPPPAATEQPAPTTQDEAVTPTPQKPKKKTAGAKMSCGAGTCG